jgi:hypothetical protein
MITREEYMAALAIVEGYHGQLKETLCLVEDHTRVPLQTFIKEAGISSRLHTVLSWFTGLSSYTQIYLDEILWPDFRKMRNAGPKLWEEFTGKRDKYLYERRHR